MHTSRVDFRCGITTEVHELAMEHASNVQYPEVFEKFPKATHVVTRIVYGGEVAFSFEKTVEKSTYKRDIAGSLQAVMKRTAGTNIIIVF